MNIIADLLMHTMVSNHAFNTVTEMARRACKLGMFAAALTGHAVYAGRAAPLVFLQSDNASQPHRGASGCSREWKRMCAAAQTAVVTSSRGIGADAARLGDRVYP